MQDEMVLMVETAEMANLAPQVLRAPEGPLAFLVPVALKESRAQKVTQVAEEQKEIKEMLAFPALGAVPVPLDRMVSLVDPAKMEPTARTAGTALLTLFASPWLANLNCLSMASVSVLVVIWGIPIRFFPRSHPAVTLWPSAVTTCEALQHLSALSVAL
jgi:hypothetical protein